MIYHSNFQQQLNGQPVDITDLPVLAGLNYGHFTSMQVRQKKVRGLRLHLQRLEQSSLQLFQCSVHNDTIQAYIRHILADDDAPCSLRIHVFVRPEHLHTAKEEHLQVLITKSAPLYPGSDPIAVKSYTYERILPAIKHAGIALGILAYKQQALAAGFDDVLYTDSQGNISEGSVWNIGFYDGKKVVVPTTPALPGITLQLITAKLPQFGIEVISRAIHLDELANFTSAFAMNSILIGQSIARINDRRFTVDPAFSAVLEEAYARNDWEPVFS